jgi:predicted NACHT family NTPase
MQKANLLGAEPEPGKLQDAEREAYDEARRQAESLWAQLRSNPGLLLVARMPLILSLMLLLHHFRVAELPRGRAALYKRCLEVLLEIWDAKEKRLVLPGSLRLADKLAVLRAVSYYFLDKDLLQAGTAELEEVIAPLLPRLSASELPAPEILRHSHERSGVLVEQALGRYGFAHRALADSLAARHVVDHELDDRLLERIGEERWREVTLIAVGMAPPARGGVGEGGPGNRRAPVSVG